MLLATLVSMVSLFGSMPWFERFLSLGINKKFLSSVINVANAVSNNGDINSALNTIKNDKELQIEFQKELLKLEDAYWKDVFKDRQNARARDLTLQKMKGKNRRANIMFVVAILGLFFWEIILLK